MDKKTLMEMSKLRKIAVALSGNFHDFFFRLPSLFSLSMSLLKVKLRSQMGEKRAHRHSDKGYFKQQKI